MRLRYLQSRTDFRLHQPPQCVRRWSVYILKQQAVVYLNTYTMLLGMYTCLHYSQCYVYIHKLRVAVFVYTIHGAWYAHKLDQYSVVRIQK